MDIDINVSTPHSRANNIVDLFAPIGFRPDGPVQGRPPVAGLPLVRDAGAATIDPDAIEERLIEIRGPSLYERVSRFRRMLRTAQER